MKHLTSTIYRYLTTFKENHDTLNKVYFFISENFDDVFNEFYEELLKHDRYRNKITADIVPYLKNRLIQFFSAWFSKDLDETVLKITENVVKMHQFVGLNDMDMMYGLTLLKKGFIRRIYSYHSISSEERDIWIEHLLNRISLIRIVFEYTYLYNEESSYQLREKINLEDIVRQHLMNLFDLKKYIKIGINPELLNIPLDYTECQVQSYIDEAKRLNLIDEETYKQLIDIHSKWHEEYRNLIHTKNPEFIKSLEIVSEEFIKVFRDISLNYETIFLISIDKILIEIANFIIRLFDVFKEEIYLKENLDENELNRVLKLITVDYGHIFEDMYAMYESDLCLLNLDYSYRGIVYTSERTISIYIKPSKIIDKYTKSYPELKKLFDVMFSIVIKIINVMIKYNVLLIQSKKLVIQAEENAKHKDIFLANMSHELRTPLNAIIGFSQILAKRKDVPDSVRQYIDKINISGKTLLEIINNVLDLVKIESGKIDIKPSKFDLENLISEVKSIVEPLAKGKGIDLSFVNKLKKQEIFADYTLLKQVFLNLLSNAIKFTPNAGNVTVEIGEIDFNKIYISVCDTGVGIAPEDIDKLFKPFSQIENPLQKSTKGTGLGLVIIKKIIQMHKGNIKVESEVGKGTCFHIEIPRNIYEESIIAKSISDKEFLVIVIEDDKLFGDFLMSCLEKEFDVLWLKDPSNINLYIKDKSSDKIFIISDFIINGYDIDKMIDFIDKVDKKRFLLISSDDKIINLPQEVEYIRKDNIVCDKLIEYIKKILSV